jgi:transcriptional regulator with XRE-family HTH domain
MKAPRPTSTAPTGTEFGKLLRELRTTADLSISDVAKNAGLDQTALTRMETGTASPPDVATLMPLPNAIGVHQGSNQFEELWKLAEQERHPEADAAKYIDSIKGLTKTKGHGSSTFPVRTIRMRDVRPRQAEAGSTNLQSPSF